MRVLITGATGLIGRHSIVPLNLAGYEVYCVSARKKSCTDGRVHWIQRDLLNFAEIAGLFAEVRPTHLLHFAWETGAGTYLESCANFDWVQSSFEMLRQFQRYGGMRAVFAGTCFEYQFANIPLREDMELNPVSTYARCKNLLRQLSEIYATKIGLSFAWGRIFYVYGPGEQGGRLVPYVIQQMRAGNSVVIQSADLVKDYMYAGDVADAFVALLNSETTGCVNICSGIPIAVREIASRIARFYGNESLLQLRNEPTTQPPMIVGAPCRLMHDVGFVPQFAPLERLERFLETNPIFR